MSKKEKTGIVIHSLDELKQLIEQKEEDNGVPSIGILVHTPGQTELEDAQVALVSGKVPENVSEELILREFDSKQEIYIIFR